MDVKEKVGKKIKDIREANNLTQEKLAEELDVQTNTIGKAETGRHFITASLLSKLCEYFKVDETYFFNFNYAPYNAEDLEKIEIISKKLKTLSPETLDFIYKTVNAVS